MELTPQLKMQIDNYFANVSAEELYKILTEKYNLKDLTENDERFTRLMRNVVTMFLYGSTVYGTLTDRSDTDIVVIVNDDIDLSEFTNGIWEYHLDNNDYQFINESRFIEMVKNIVSKYANDERILCWNKLKFHKKTLTKYLGTCFTNNDRKEE